MSTYTLTIRRKSITWHADGREEVAFKQDVMRSMPYAFCAGFQRQFPEAFISVEAEGEDHFAHHHRAKRDFQPRERVERREGHTDTTRRKTRRESDGTSYADAINASLRGATS